jgi:hypothetical protein
VTLSLLERSEDSEKIKHASKNLEDFKRMKHVQRIERVAVEMECRTSHNQVMGHDPKFEKCLEFCSFMQQFWCLFIVTLFIFSL